jgi:hypothetical protein
MATLEIPVKVLTTVDTLKIELPYYCSDSYTMWAILAEDRILSVNDWVRIKQANIWLLSEVPMAATNSSVKAITREEFMEMYNRVLERINQAL